MDRGGPQMGNVIYIRTFYFPNEEQRKMLEKMQQNLHFNRVHYLHSIRNDSPKMKMAKDAYIKQQIRNRLYVVLGQDREEISLQEEVAEL
jgi:hypothetical protein